MALPQKHNVTANVQVSGGAILVVALENAVKMAVEKIGQGFIVTDDEVVQTARTFANLLQEDGEGHAADDQQPGGGE